MRKDEQESKYKTEDEVPVKSNRFRRVNPAGCPEYTFNAMSDEQFIKDLMSKRKMSGGGTFCSGQNTDQGDHVILAHYFFVHPSGKAEAFTCRHAYFDALAVFALSESCRVIQAVEVFLHLQGDDDLVIEPTEQEHKYRCKVGGKLVGTVYCAGIGGEA